MIQSKRTRKALKALNLDLFQPETLTPPAPVTLHTKIKEATQLQQPVENVASIQISPSQELPSVAELYRMFERFNWLYFNGKLPRVTIMYSNRMTSAGSYAPHKKLIRIGRKYHEIFPGDIEDTLKHEMIHIIHFRHDVAFKAEAKRIGASVRAKSHPSLRKPPKYIYECPNCLMEYPRQKRLVMASCGKCSKGKRFDPRYKLRRKRQSANKIQK